MKKRNRYIMGITILLAIILLGYIFLFSSKTTFEKAILNHLDVTEISSIEIIKSSSSKENKLNITDPITIQKIMDGFSKASLKKTRPSTIDFVDSYWITIKENNKRRLGIIIYDTSYMMTYEYAAESPTNRNSSYRIISGFDGTNLTDLFK